MSKISKVLIILLVIIVSVKIVYATGSIGKGFGARILKTEATEITTTEAEGYTCDMAGGTSIEVQTISPKSAPTAYYIPSSVKPKTGAIGEKRLILGKYDGFFSISCTQDTGEGVKIVFLDTISMFGTSKR